MKNRRGSKGGRPDQSDKMKKTRERGNLLNDMDEAMEEMGIDYAQYLEAVNPEMIDVESDDFNPLTYVSKHPGEVIPPLPLPSTLEGILDELSSYYNKEEVGRASLLTKGVAKRLLHYIRNGAYDYIACEAAGIDTRTFYLWLRKGKNDLSSNFHPFYIEVMKARAIARAGAEMEVRKANPLAWLRFGPGKDKPNRPGWTETATYKNTTEGKLSITDLIRKASDIDEGRDGPDLSSGRGEESVDDTDLW